MSTLTTLISQTELTDRSFEQYEVVENKKISQLVIQETEISGVLFSLATFTGVTFKKVDFFAVRFENCEFIDCTFIDCNFQFSTILYSDFHRATFLANHWCATPIKKCLVAHSTLDGLTQLAINSEENRIMAPLSAFEQTLTMVIEKMAA